MSNPKDNAVFIQWITMIATMCATIFIFRLIGGNFFEYRTTDATGGVTVVPGWTDKVWLTLSSILFAELLSFGYGIVMSGKSSRINNTFPYQFTAIGMIVIYDFGVASLALAALTPISIEWLAALHTILFVLLVIGLAAYQIGGGIVEDIEIRDRQQRQPANNWRQQVQDLVDMATKIKERDASDFSKALGTLSDDLEYATSESLPGSENADREITEELNSLHAELQNLINNQTQDLYLPASNFVKKVDELKLTIQRRDKLMITLRS